MLNPNTVYRKTDAGIAEMQARSLGLRAELRRLLILIDGAATLTRLATFVRGSEIDLLIGQLESHGLITASLIGLTPGETNVKLSVLVAAAPTPAARTPPAEGDGVLEPTAAQVAAVRRVAIRTLHDILGPDSDHLAISIEQCKSAQELRVTITEVRQYLDRQLGADVGQRFLNAVRGAAAEGTR